MIPYFYWSGLLEKWSTFCAVFSVSKVEVFDYKYLRVLAFWRGCLWRHLWYRSSALFSLNAYEEADLAVMEVGTRSPATCQDFFA